MEWLKKPNRRNAGENRKYAQQVADPLRKARMESAAWCGVALAGFAASQIPGLWPLAGVSLVPIALGFYRLERLQEDADERLKQREADIAQRFENVQQRYHHRHIAHCKKIASELLAPLDTFETSIRGDSGDLLGTLGRYRQAVTAATVIAESRAGVDVPREALLVHRYLEGVVTSWMPRFEAAEIEFELDLSKRLPEGVFVNRPTLDLVIDHVFHAVLRRGRDGEVFLHATFGKDGLTLAFSDDARGLAPGDPIVCERTATAQRMAIAIKGKGRTAGDIEMGVETRITLPATVFEAQGVAAPYDDSIYIRPGLDLAERTSLITPGVIDLTEELHSYAESREEINAKREADRRARRAARRRERTRNSGVPPENPSAHSQFIHNLAAADPRSASAAGRAIETEKVVDRPSDLPSHSLQPTPRLLFVEDLILNQTVFVSQAEAIGARVVCVGTAEACLEALEASKFDMIVMDLHMPGIGGIVGIREIRRLHGESLPVIAYTADTDPLTHQSALDAGADAVLTKPASEAELREALQTHLSTRRAA